ncbi:MEDS domain-containing protein [Amycolatopsis alkalitolerans]|uniref:MEDS domain-containing protein n=1 Tax=Amycolatopsis alkalitolerans TaxID=2547244 RepID=UPI00190FAC1B|nr:MEDS domain-containing protein [Amycolatopsis alkalitolerans]
MSGAIETGLRELVLSPGDHACVFYRGALGRDEVLHPYLRAGLHAGDKCVCVVDSPGAAEGVTNLAEESARDRQLDVHLSETSYLAGGAFTRKHMLQFWCEHLDKAAQLGFTFCRVVGEMTWALRDVPGVEDLVRYEAELNEVAAGYPTAILCLYDLDRFSGEVVAEVVKTHPKVLIGGMLVENPYYVAPDEFLRQTQA